MLLSDIRGKKGLPHAILGCFLASPTDRNGVSVSGWKARNQVRFEPFLLRRCGTGQGLVQRRYRRTSGDDRGSYLI